jgi:hypothetical protein
MTLFPRKRFEHIAIGLASAVIAASPNVLAQDKPKRVRTQPPVRPLPDVQESLESGRTPPASTVEHYMEQAVRNIAARYNLNDVQTQKTQELMKREVYRFLKDHEENVWPVLRDLLAAQLRPPDDAATLKRVGATAGPLLAAAKESIYTANEEWRLLLNDEQRKVHDYDLAEMDTTFKKISSNFEAWSDGRKTDGGIFPQPDLALQPDRPVKPPDGDLPKPVVEPMFDPKHVLEVQVEAFIKEYELDEGQITAAKSILEEYKAKADEFRSAQKDEFAKIAADFQTAREKRDLDEMKKAWEAHKKLLAPFSLVCDDMRDRLRAQLTTAQIQRHAEKAKDGKKPAATSVTKKAADKEAEKPKDSPPPSGGSD